MTDTTGTQTLRGIIVGLRDVPRQITVDEVRAQLEEVVDAYTIVSCGRLQLVLPESDPVITVDLDASKNSANISELTRMAAAKIYRDLGIDVTQDDRRTWDFAGIRGPLVGGNGWQGGTDAYVFNGSLHTRAHELGHNLGLQHAGANNDEAGDATSWMASKPRGLVGITAPERDQLGWLRTRHVLDVSPDDQRWSLTLDDLDAPVYDTERRRVLRMWNRNTGQRLWISFRGSNEIWRALPSWAKGTIHVHEESARYWQRAMIPVRSARALPFGGVLKHYYPGQVDLEIAGVELAEPPVAIEPLRVTTPNRHFGRVGEPVEILLIYDGGTGREVRWSLIGDGALPPGLWLDGNTITGVPQRSGIWRQRVRVRDSSFATASEVLEFRIRRPENREEERT